MELLLDQDLAHDLVEVLLVGMVSLAGATEDPASQLVQAEVHGLYLLGEVRDPGTQIGILQDQVDRVALGFQLRAQGGILGLDLLPTADFRSQGISQPHASLIQRHDEDFISSDGASTREKQSV
jgi:hypothetical protein